MMKALIWKDYRLNRGYLLMGLVLMATPYVIGATVILRDRGRGAALASPWAELLAMAAVASVSLSTLTIVTLTGNAIAGERVDRSAEFLASLPPSRRQVLASKLVVPLAATVIIWSFNLLSAHIVSPALGSWPAYLERPSPWWLVLSACWVVVFGAGWFWSALLDSPAIATGLAVGTSLLLVWVAQLIGWFLENAEAELGIWWILAPCFLTGPVLFIAGSVYYLRRVEP